jgi:hypothetical protein
MFAYQALGKPFKHEIVNWICTINEATLFAVASIQTIFITDLREVQVIVMTGWVMIGLTTCMILINFAVIVPFTIVHKCRQWKAKSNRLVFASNVSNTTRNLSSPSIFQTYR